MSINAEKTILEATCGSRTIWFDKHNPSALYVDCRRESFSNLWKGSTRTCDVAPDRIVDFTNMPFEDNTFWHVVFVAVGGGTVTESGMCYGTQRKERLGMHVTYVTDDGLTCTYFRLGEVYVRAGDRVDDGQPIGKASWQEDARVEVRQNGRRLDVCRWLGMGGQQ